MKVLILCVVIMGTGLLLAGTGVHALELNARASFNTLAMDYLNGTIEAYPGRTGVDIPSLNSGSSLYGSLTIGLAPLIDFGLAVEGISATARARSAREGLISFDTSALGILAISSYAILQGALDLRATAGLGWYSGSYSSNLEGIEAQGSGIGYKLGIAMGLKVIGNLSLNGALCWRGLAINELIEPRGDILTARGPPYLDFSGFELGLGMGWRF